MSTEPGGVERATPRRRSGLWGGIAVTAGAAFAIVAVLHLGGIAYVIVAILAGLAYTLTSMYRRRDDD
jgi:hypothetical protein